MATYRFAFDSCFLCESECLLFTFVCLPVYDVPSHKQLLTGSLVQTKVWCSENLHISCS